MNTEKSRIKRKVSNVTLGQVLAAKDEHNPLFLLDKPIWSPSAKMFCPEELRLEFTKTLLDALSAMKESNAIFRDDLYVGFNVLSVYSITPKKPEQRLDIGFQVYESDNFNDFSISVNFEKAGKIFLGWTLDETSKNDDVDRYIDFNTFEEVLEFLKDGLH